MATNTQRKWDIFILQSSTQDEFESEVDTQFLDIIWYAFIHIFPWSHSDAYKANMTKAEMDSAYKEKVRKSLQQYC